MSSQTPKPVDPQDPTVKLSGSCSLVGTGKFGCSFLWLAGESKSPKP